MRRIGAIVSAAALAALAVPAQGFELQGHRGARGLFPENTLPAFAAALSIGVDVLELDLALSRDRVLVVAHDPAPLPRLARRDGAFIQAPDPPLHQQELRHIRGYDVGRINPADRYARQFPEQKPVDGTGMPTLAEVFALAERAGADRVRFNIEIKTSPEEPGLSADPSVFADAVAAAVRQAGMASRATVQSFDWRPLRRSKSIAPEIRTAYLTAEQSWLDTIRRGQAEPSPWTGGISLALHGGSIPEAVKAAGGDVWSPFHRDLNDADLARAHEIGLQVVVWTVNDPGEMRALIDRGVDGIITDYPDRLRTVAAEAGLPLPPPHPIQP